MFNTSLEFYRLKEENFATRLAQANLASKNNIANFVKKTGFYAKLKINKKIFQIKHELAVNELKEKTNSLESSLFIGQSYFNNDKTQLKIKE